MPPAPAQFRVTFRLPSHRNVTWFHKPARSASPNARGTALFRVAFRSPSNHNVTRVR